MWKHSVPSKPMTHVKARISLFIVDIRKDVPQGCDGQSSEHALVCGLGKSGDTIRGV